MTSKIYKLKEKVIAELPPGELPWTVFGRLMVKTGIRWKTIKEDTEVPPDQFQKALEAVEEMFGKKFII